MAIDTAIRSRGLGGTDVAAILGMSPFRSPFDVWAEKSGLLDAVIEETERQSWGKRLQKLIALEAYPEITGRKTRWLDETRRNPKREWQVWTPDAECTDEPRLLDAKTCGLDQSDKWGQGVNEVPDYVALQAAWYMSAGEYPVCDIALLIAGSDFRIYTLNRDPDIEGVILEEAEKFWKEHIVAGVPPPMTATEGAARYLRSRFPSSNGVLRIPSDDEWSLIQQYRLARRSFDSAKETRDDIEARVKLSIADADGFKMPDGERLTYKQTKGRKQIDWESLALPLLNRLSEDERNTLVGLHTNETPGFRRMYVKFQHEDQEKK